MSYSWTAFVVAVLVLAPCRPGAAETVLVALETEEGLSTPSVAPAVLVAEPLEDFPREPHPTRRAVTIPGRTPLDLLAGSVWQVRLEAEGWWAAPLRLESVEPGVVLTLQAFRTGTLRGRLAGRAPGEPETLNASFLRRRNRVTSESTPGAVPCEVGADRAFQCTLPAGVVDVRLEPFGAAPEVRWNLELAAAETADLGTVRLRAPAALRGLAIDEATGRPLDGVSLELRPAELGKLHLAEAERFALAGAETETSRGAFALSSLAPGVYDLLAASDGWSPATVAGLRLEAGQTLELSEPVVLQHPGTLELYFVPNQDPDGNPWRVRLLREDGAGGVELVDLETPEADLAGWWLVNGLRPGTYRLQIATQLSRRWLDRELTVEPGLNTLHLDIGGVPVRGVLTAGDEPVAGGVWFGGRTGQRSIRMAADEQGRFEGQLPHVGEWPIDVYRDTPERVQHLAPVLVEEPKPGETAYVEIELPDTVLRGKVVTQEEQAVPGAVIVVLDPTGRRLEATDRTDERGRFEFVGLEEGRFFIEARSEEGRSPAREVEVAEGHPGSEVTLTVVGQITVRGQVSAASGPVPGTAILAVPFSRAPAVPVPASTATTGADGRFEMELSGAVTGFKALVRAPGHPVSAVVVTDLSRDVTISVPEVGGRLVLVSGGAASLDDATLEYEGIVFPLAAYRRYLGLFGGGGRQDEVVLPDMAPGTYSLCCSAASRPSADRGRPACSTAYLPPGGEMQLQASQETPK